MFDFSFAELFVVIVAAIFLIGPKDIPAVMKSLGQGFRRLQYIRFAMSEQFEKFMEENDLNEIRHYSVDPMKSVHPAAIMDEQAFDEDEHISPLPFYTTQKDLEEYALSLKPFCGKITAYRPAKWRKANPFFDHCVPVSLMIQDKFGGQLKLVTAINKEDPEDHVGHVLNVINGKEFDATIEQFEDKYKFVPKEGDLKTFADEREMLLADPELRNKYILFKEKAGI